MISAAFAALLIHTADTTRPRDVEVFGIGSSACAYWRSNDAREREGQAWLLGYWSGLNRMNGLTGIVGSTAEGAGILREVVKVCGDNSVLTLEDATYQAYLNLQAARR
jgi:hypothetical protein